MTNIASRVMYLISGIVYLFLGILVLNNPVTALTSLVLVVALMLLFSGIITLVDGFRVKASDTGNLVKGHLIFEGILVTSIGLLFLFGSNVFGVIVLAKLMVIWFIVISITHITYSLVAFTGFMRILGLALNIFLLVFSISLLFNPILATGSLVWFMSIHFMILAFDRFMHVFIAIPKQG